MTKAMYIAIFKKCIELVPALTEIEFFGSDYEDAILLAAKEVWPNITLRGCLFHYMQVHLNVAPYTKTSTFNKDHFKLFIFKRPPYFLYRNPNNVKFTGSLLPTFKKSAPF